MMINKRVVIIGRDADSHMEYDGGEYLAARVADMVRECFQGNTDTIQIYRPFFLQRFVNILCRQSYGMNKQIRKKTEVLLEKNTELIFFNGSVYGTLVKKMHRRKIQTAVFYYNVESQFYYEKYRLHKNLPNFVMYRYILWLEKLSTKYADIVITLNQRDSNGLNRIYGRKADFCSPASFEPVSRSYIEKGARRRGKKYLLFVGGINFANIEGLQRFIKNVFPYIDFDLYVIGNCCRELEKAVNTADYPGLRLLGFRDDIEKIYMQASAVIVPIYYGSGMKTKTVEALKYGKYIFGTPEAFAGIPIDCSKAGALCRNDEEFIKKIRLWGKKEHGLFCAYSYEFFMKHYTKEAVTANFCENLKALL